MSYIKKLDVGNIKLNNNVFLAPMAGVTDIAFRKIVRDVSSPALTFTEMASSKAMEFGSNKTEKLLKIPEYERPSAVQIFGSNKTVISDTIKKLNEDENIDIIDINMGCPVPKVAVRAQAGSALLKDPDKIFDIVSSVVSAVNVPVTVKIRSGWDSNHINAVEVAKVIEKAGASAICVHPRTRSQGYSGKADWNIIKEVKENVSIPVIGNGDIKSPEDAKRMLEETKCDAVMIGRGVLGNPWLIKNIVNYLDGKDVIDVSIVDRIDMCLKHLKLLDSLKNEKLACLEIRNHISWYFKGIKGANELKNKVYQTTNIHDIILLLNEFKEAQNEEKDRG